MVNKSYQRDADDDDEPANPNPSLEEVVGLVLDVDPASINDESAINEVENWDSFQHVILLKVVEETYNVKFTDEEMQQIDKVGKIREAIDAERNK